MNSPPQANGKAVLLRIDDPEKQAYLQRYPFATGPNRELNESCRQELRKVLASRSISTDAATDVFHVSDSEPGQGEFGQANRFLQATNIPTKKFRALCNHFGWKVQFVPKGKIRVLSLGCGAGVELAFLRAVSPDAELLAVDWTDSLLPALKPAVRASFTVADYRQYLKDNKVPFDLIFSNHFLEHLYDPDTSLELIYAALAPGGRLVSALPLDADPEGTYAARLAKFVSQPDQMDAIDIGILDAGHPWKTNPADLLATLRRAGFGRIRLYQRRDHWSVAFRGSWRAFRRTRAIGLGLNTIMFGLPRLGLRFLVRHGVEPTELCRWLFAVERRFWFGSNNLKNRFSPEMLLVAEKEPTTDRVLRAGVASEQPSDSSKRLHSR